MNKRNIELLKNSWAKVAWDSPRLVSIFHVELFNRDHEAQALFVGDKSNRVTGMMKAIDVAINNLDDWDSFTPFLQDFGRRHNAYGVLKSHYRSFFATHCFRRWHKCWEANWRQTPEKRGSTCTSRWNRSWSMHHPPSIERQPVAGKFVVIVLHCERAISPRASPP